MARWQLILTVILTDRQHIASNFHLYLVPEHPNCILAFEHACKAVVLPFNLFTAPHQNHSICIHNQTALSFACEKQNTEPHNGAKITFCFGNWYVLSSQCNVLTVRHFFFLCSPWLSWNAWIHVCMSVYVLNYLVYLLPCCSHTLHLSAQNVLANNSLTFTVGFQALSSCNLSSALSVLV